MFASIYYDKRKRLRFGVPFRCVSHNRLHNNCATLSILGAHDPFTRLLCHRLCHVVPLSPSARRERKRTYEQAGGRARAPAASGNGGPETPRSSLAVHFGRTDFNPAAAAVTVVAAAAPRRIYVRFVIDEPEWCERGCTSVEGAYPTLSQASRGVSRDGGCRWRKQ